MGNELALIPVVDLQVMAKAIAGSGLFSIKTPEQALALMLFAQAEGRHPASVAMEYDIIQNKPALRSQAALIRFQNAGGKIQWLTRTETEVSAKFSHPQGGDITVTWNMERARQMGYDGKDNWKKQPMIMMQWRVVAEGVRACYPACLSGQYLDVEVRDFDAPGKPIAAEFKEVKQPQEKPAPAPEPSPAAGEMTGQQKSDIVQGRETPTAPAPQVQPDEILTVEAALKVPEGVEFSVSGELIEIRPGVTKSKIEDKKEVGKKPYTVYHLAQNGHEIKISKWGAVREGIHAHCNVLMCGCKLKNGFRGAETIDKVE